MKAEKKEKILLKATHSSRLSMTQLLKQVISRLGVNHPRLDHGTQLCRKAPSHQISPPASPPKVFTQPNSSLQFKQRQ